MREAPPSGTNSDENPGWSRPSLGVFRFVFLLAILWTAIFLGPYVLQYSPLESVAQHWLTAIPPLWAPINWVTEHVLGLTPTPVATQLTGFLCVAALAGAGSVIWSLVGSSRTQHRGLHRWLRVYLRFALGTLLIGYGMLKVFLNQFGTNPSLETLMTPLGELGPRGLLPVVMNRSSLFQGFGGWVEVLAGVLVVLRWTVPLGALLAAGAMTLVLILNFGYHFSMYVLPITMLAMALALVIPSMQRLGTALISERAIPPGPRSALFAGRRTDRFAAAFGLFVLLAVLWVNVRTNVEASRRRRGPLPPLYGVYVTETIDPIGGTGMRTLGEQSRWQWVTVDAVGPFVRMNTHGFITIASPRQSIHFNYRADTSRRTLTLVPPGNAKAPQSVWSYSTPDSASLVLVGAINGEDSVRITLRRRNLDSFPLLQSPPSVVRRLLR